MSTLKDQINEPYQKQEPGPGPRQARTPGPRFRTYAVEVDLIIARCPDCGTFWGLEMEKTFRSAGTPYCPACGIPKTKALKCENDRLQSELATAKQKLAALKDKLKSASRVKRR